MPAHLIHVLLNRQPAPEDERALVINKYRSIGPLCSGLESELHFAQVHIGDIQLYQFMPYHARFFAGKMITVLSLMHWVKLAYSICHSMPYANSVATTCQDLCSSHQCTLVVIIPTCHGFQEIIQIQLCLNRIF